jgi:hypothetical protein
MALNLLRNARLFVSTVNQSAGTPLFTDSDTWEIPLMSDFSFSQATETADITINETGTAPTRGSLRFSAALNPVDWSFSTYMRLYKINASATGGDTIGSHRILDRIMWHGLVTDNAVSWTSASPIGSNGTTSFDIDFSDSNIHRFTLLYFYIKADNKWYKISGVQVNQAEVDASIDSIGMITWSGFGTTMAEITAPSASVTAETRIMEYSSPVAFAGNAVSATITDADYIIQKYTTLTITDNRTAGYTPPHAATAYAIPITGGSITINNNVTYLTPETLGIVNTPIGSFTGSREISGSVTAYLRSGAATDAAALLKDLLGFTSETTTSYSTVFSFGGASAPKVTFTMAHCHLSIPTMDVQDVLSVNIDFKALPYTGAADARVGDLTATNELIVSYTALTSTSDVNNDK